MPKRDDIKKILIIGSGPIIIGQACEFDYSGTQAVKALKNLGYETILVNSNPATIMTDSEIADKTYIEPINKQTIAKIIKKEKPDALLPTMGGQTSLNVTVELAEDGILKLFGVELIGAQLDAIRKAEDRELFKNIIKDLHFDLPRGGIAKNKDEAFSLISDIDFPVIIRPAFTLGGTGGSVVFNKKEYEKQIEWGLSNSFVNEVLIEESVIGWKEFELEVMRDIKDNVVIICSIENIDPMGIHTGDSLTVAPIQTLSDREYQFMRDAAKAIIRKIGVETGGSNIQFAVNPETGKMVVIEMNPRVSRSSALASKATGFPIAKIAAQLAVGLTLDEIQNDITGKTPACFEPVLDYTVIKIPRWNFEKFPQTSSLLGTQMKAIGETMAIGRTFKESLQKAMRSLECDWCGFGIKDNLSVAEYKKKIMQPTPERLLYIGELFRKEAAVNDIYSLTGIDKWFLYQINDIIKKEKNFCKESLRNKNSLLHMKKAGFSDKRISQLAGESEENIRNIRHEQSIKPVYKVVDTCAAEFESATTYLYSTYEQENEAKRNNKPKAVILGSGPNRIGQGIEFDYCCVHAVMALQEAGYEAIMINNNPETVSTDYDIADKLYFEALTLEDVLNVIEIEKPEGIIVQLGGQTPLKLAHGLEKNGIKILGTSTESIDIAEDRSKLGELIKGTDIKQPEWGTAFTLEEAKKVAQKIGFPVLLRPSYVLGGRGMEIVYDNSSLEKYITEAASLNSEYPVFIDKFLEDAFEFDIDAIRDGNKTIVCGFMQHIEEAGIHSGDSSCVLPPYMIGDEDYKLIVEQTRLISDMLNVKGLINIQFALRDGNIYILEVNPRASRTVPFVSKAVGIPWAKIAAKIMIGSSLDDFNIDKFQNTDIIAIKTPVFPFMHFPHVHVYPGPEMRSTGEVMGIDTTFGGAFAKAQFAAGHGLPKKGNTFISVNDNDKISVIPVARQLYELGFKIIATQGTYQALRKAGIPVKPVHKVGEGRPNSLDLIINGEIQIIINTPLGKISRSDEYKIGRTALAHDVPCLTTLSAAWAAIQAIRTLQSGPLNVCTIQEVEKM